MLTCVKRRKVSNSRSSAAPKKVFKVVGVSVPPSRTAASPLFPHPSKEGGFFAGREMRKSLFTFSLSPSFFPAFFALFGMYFPFGEKQSWRGMVKG